MPEQSFLKKSRDVICCAVQLRNTLDMANFINEPLHPLVVEQYERLLELGTDWHDIAGNDRLLQDASRFGYYRPAAEASHALQQASGLKAIIELMKTLRQLLSMPAEQKTPLEKMCRLMAEQIEEAYPVSYVMAAFAAADREMAEVLADPELDEVRDIWPDLPRHIRDAVLTLVRSANVGNADNKTVD